MILDSAIDLAPSSPKRNTKIHEYGNAVLLLQRAADVAAICGGLVLALRAHDTPWSNQLLWPGVMSVGLFIFFADMKNVYRSWRTGSVRTEILYTVEAWIAVFIGLFAIWSIWPTLVYPAGVMLTWLVATSMLLVASRVATRHLLRIARTQGLNTIRLAVDNVFIALPTSQCAREIDTLIEALGDTTGSVYLLQDRRRSRLPWQSRVDERVSDAIPKPFQQDPLHRCWMEIGGIPAVACLKPPSWAQADGSSDSGTSSSARSRCCSWPCPCSPSRSASGNPARAQSCSSSAATNLQARRSKSGNSAV